jgi:hypothetical protein
MNVVQPVVRRRDGYDPRGLAQRGEAIALLEIAHEICNAMAGWRPVPTD